jgi:predicted amidohydrolase
MRIGLVQMRCEKGTIARNLEVTLRHLDQATSLGIDILAFPEMSITGYADPTRCAQAVLRLDGPEVAALADLTRERAVTVLAGLIEENPHGKPFVTQVVLRDGKLVGFYRKVTIEGDELPWFSPGNAVPVFRHDDMTFGLAVCADISNCGVFAECARQGATIVFEVAAPGLYGERTTRDWRASFEWWEGECRKRLGGYALKHGLWIAVATQAGRTVDEDFPGGGYVFAPGGDRVYATPDWKPCAVYLDLDLCSHGVKVLGPHSEEPSAA